MKKGLNYIIDITLRYAILIFVGILSVKIFYLLITPITIYPVYSLLNLFFNTAYLGDILFVNTIPIEIIGPCIAGSAYYLLLILNLSTPKIKLKKRLLLLGFSFASLLIVNVLRIFLLASLFISGASFFDMAHKAFWYAGSVLFVVGIWFLSVRLFKIKEIPLYSDFRFLWDSSRKNMKKSKSSKKH